MTDEKSFKNSFNNMGGYFTALPSVPWSAQQTWGLIRSSNTSQNSIKRLGNEIRLSRNKLQTPQNPSANEAFAIRDFLG